MSNGPFSRIRTGSGYALLVTLVMLALLGVILVGLARLSTDKALMARDAEDELRTRWAERSCKQALLLGAALRFETRSDAWSHAHSDESVDQLVEPEPPRMSETLLIPLNGVSVRVRIDDEQAKINLNARLLSDPQASGLPRAVIDDVLRPVIATQAALTRPELLDPLGLLPVESWSQVLPGYGPADLLGVSDGRPWGGSSINRGVASRVTLWGDGRINLLTADKEVIRRHLGKAVSSETIAALLMLREEQPALGLGAMIDNATADHKDDRRTLSALITNRSHCFTMWLAIEPTKRKQPAVRWSLHVTEGETTTTGALERPRIKSYYW